MGRANSFDYLTELHRHAQDRSARISVKMVMDAAEASPFDLEGDQAKAHDAGCLPWQRAPH
jgi:hypothetical protein